MGKQLETKHSNVSHRIIKKSTKYDKTKITVKPGTEKSNSSATVKVKTKSNHWGINDINDEPLAKVPRLFEEQTENVQCDDLEESAVDVSWDSVRKNEIFENKVFAERNVISRSIYLKVDDPYCCDLFFVDELRNSYVNFITRDLYFHIIDEICLEGLDGITCEAFWKRLSNSLEWSLNISQKMKEYIWKVLRKNPNFQFYELPQPRGDLEIHDRFKYLNADIGVVMELAYELPDIYPYKMVTDPNVKGSCSTFDERIDVSDKIMNMSLEEVESYGQKLVIVASQSLRNQALINEMVDPLIEMQNMEYCVLERIGRSRKLGELTQGNMSIASFFNMDSKGVFHYKKKLYNNNLISKQSFFIKSVVTDQNKTGRLFQLKRFHNKVKSKYLWIAEKVVGILKKQPEYRIDVAQLRIIFGTTYATLGKIFKSQTFKKFVKTDAVYPYKYIYPNAAYSEYMKKSGEGEKYVRCFELRNPHINLVASWNKDDEDSDGDDENGEDEELTGGKIYNMDICREVYFYVFSSGEEGCSATHLKKIIGVDKNTIRMVLRNLLQKRVLDVEKCDKGKQREMIFKAVCLKNQQTEALCKSESRVAALKLFESQRAARQKIKKHPVMQDITSPIKCDSLDIFPTISENAIPKMSNYYFLVRRLLTDSKSILDMKVELNSNLIRDTIKLTYKQFSSGMPVDFKEIMDINGSVFKPVVRINFENDCCGGNSIDWITKLILLKATLGEISINSESLCILNRKRTHSEMELPKLSQELTTGGPLKFFDQKLQYMGDNPFTVFKEKDGEVTVEIVVSTTPSEYRIEKEYPETKCQTKRVATRLQIILDVIHENKIMEHAYRMEKIIIEEEMKTGYCKKLDRKSLARLLKKLVEEGYLKIYKVTISDSKILKTVLFMCHPTISYNDDLIQSSIQQLKWKHFVGCAKKTTQTNVPIFQTKLEEIKDKKQSPFSEVDVMNSIKDLKNIEKLKMTDMKNKYNKQAAKKYGIKPKFVRMRILHEFLFYLIYEYNKPIQPLKNDELDELFQKYRIKLPQEDLEGLPIVYCKEYSWKMFIPPLPQHKGWENGWALMCDVILRLPISVLCKVHACPYELPELLETLHHPIKRFFLVKDLPETIRNVVLHNRKYLFNIHESICRLAYCGLIQYGPKKYKEKDQIFVYLNRRASILNTTSSSPAYNKIENKEYPQLAFYFNSHSDLDDYWYNMNAVCTSTKLNARNPGELVTIVDASANPELMKALNSKTPEEAIQDDNGEIPGDRQGASGLDSSLFSHLTRNWFWPIKQFSTKKIKGLKSERMNKVLPQVKPFKDLGTTNKSTKVYLHKGQTSKNRKRKPQIPSRSSKKSKKLTRKINARPRKAVREYYDSIDKAIVKKIGINRRMRWSSREDELLMLCKVGELYLYRDKYKKQVVAYHVLRDVIHRVCPESANKTSRSIQRRLKKLMKHTFTQLDEQVYNLDKIPYISDNFLPLVNKISKGTNDNGDRFRLSDVQVNTAFVVLMSIIIQHEDEVKDVLQGNLISNDHLSKLNLEYTERESIEIDKPSSKFEDAKNEDDIKKDVLKCIIHSSLANKDQSNVALQLLKVYQKYPDQLIRDAVEDLKQSNTISCKRFNMKKKKIWQVPFHLSQFYVFFQFTTFNVTTAVEAYKTFLDLRNQTDSLRFSEEAINTKRYGQLLGMNEFCSFWKKLRFEFDLPQNVIILNPSIKDHGELIHELAVRFQLKLERLQKENKESEREQDGEPESLRSKCSSELEITANEESPSSDTQNTSPSPMDTDDNPLDLTVDSGNSETISRLKTWVTDCLDADRERSPSPEFMDLDRNVENNDLIDETVPVETNSIEKMDENSDDVQEISATNNKVIERIPTLEEIKEEMLRISTNDDRRIPYITDLSDLLNKESFNELTTDEKTLKRLKTHFVAQYAALQKIIVEDFEHLENHNMINLIADEMKNKKIWDKVERDIVIDKMQPVEEVAEQIKKVGGTFQDVDLMREMIEFIETKGCIGATGQQLKEKFSSSQKILPLAVLVKLLVDAGIILQAGICTITFVHYKYHSLWLAETYQLTPEEQKVLLEVKEAAAHENECSIQKELRQKKMITVKVMPWNKIDGSLNKKLFRTWMCNILSHCLDYPKISFSKLCDKFCYLKPVDIYYSLEVLQELGCIEMFVYEKRRETLFSKWEKNVERRATFLDDFEYLTIEPNNVSMTCLGSFLYDHHQEMPI